MSTPSLPSEMSSDGREVWDWADRLSERVHLADERRRLAVQIHNAQTQCGNCTMWMTNACPRERHDNNKGHKVGPSSQSIKCDKFDMGQRRANDLVAAQAKLADMDKRLGSNFA